MHQGITLGNQFTTLAAEGDKHEHDSGASSNKAEGGMDIDYLTLDAVPFSLIDTRCHGPIADYALLCP